jgi:S-adenosylmethionine:tRNA ribosyltransferase-isomerase
MSHSVPPVEKLDSVVQTVLTVPSEQEVPAWRRLDTYDYPLPKELIAKYPLEQRDQSRMLELSRETGQRRHHVFYQLPDLLEAGDVIVLNNTKVLPARLFGHRLGHTGTVELLFLHPEGAESPTRWEVMMRPARKLKPGTVIAFDGYNATATILEHRGEGLGVVDVSLGGLESVEALLEAAGEMPIPPYLEREAEEGDKTAYQTVYSKKPGSQAAPTAGLHFTEAVLQRLRDKGVHVQELTLAVGMGTFKPVTSNDIADHPMHPEYYELPEETAQCIAQAKASGRKVYAVGTTVVKTLETAAKNQGGKLMTGESGWSRLYIYPGFDFQVVDGLLTNFHLPKSTLMMLISAFAGLEPVMAAYREAVAQRYRFYSYGDCMLIR